MKTLYTAPKDSAHLVHATEARRYDIGRVRDLPQEDRPRERLMREGAAALSSPELFAVLLNVGSTKENVLELAQRIAGEYGEKGIFAYSDPQALARDFSIPLGKACQLVACGEIGRRFFRPTLNGAPILRTAADVYEYTADMRNLTKEHLRGIYLNGHYQVIHDDTISIGTVDANLIHPREVFRPALAHSAAAVILVHNHPSGVLEPSTEDCSVTAQLVEIGKLLGIEVIDHVIITRSGFTSML